MTFYQSIKPEVNPMKCWPMKYWRDKTIPVNHFDVLARYRT